jgi:UTP:GlnB (protein PII) uridylyltransferase
VSRVISTHRCDIHLVLIATEGHRAIDVFHITQDGRKLSEPAQRALRADLMAVLTNAHEAH